MREIIKCEVVFGKERREDLRPNPEPGEWYTVTSISPVNERVWWWCGKSYNTEAECHKAISSEVAKRSSDRGSYADVEADPPPWEVISQWKVKAAPSWAKCVREGQIVMNPYYTSKKKEQIRNCMVKVLRTYKERIFPWNGYGDTYTVDEYATVTYATTSGGSHGEWPRFRVGEVQVGVNIRELKQQISSYRIPSLGKRTFDTSVTDAVLDDMSARVETAVLAEASRAEVDLSTELAEAGQAVDMLRTTVPRMAKAILKYRRMLAKLPSRALRGRGTGKSGSRGKLTKEATSDAASAWLQYRYGIMPLHYSIKDAIEAINKAETMFMTVRDGESLSLDDGVSIKTDVAGFEIEHTYTQVEGVAIHGVWKGKFEKSRRSPVQLWLPTTAWELVPYSFVADWFINIGDVIQSVRPTGALASKSCLSTKTTLRYSEEVRLVTNRIEHDDESVSEAILVGSPELCRLTEESMQRVVRDFRRKLQVHAVLTWKRYTDAFALMWSSLRRKIR